MEGSRYVTKLSCHVKTVSKIVEKLGWIMAEYNFENPKEGDMVLCKIYRWSPRGPWRSSSLGCKRKAADGIEAAKRRARPTN
jgi:hypothetical protein